MATTHPPENPAGCPTQDTMTQDKEATQDGGDTEVENTPREDHPSGWLVLTRHRSVAFMIDALLDLPEYREFNQKELANFAGVSRKSVNRHLNLLKTADIISEVPNSSPTRFRFDPESPTSQAIIQIDGAMNQIGADQDMQASVSD